MENPINRSGVDAGGVNLRGQADLAGPGVVDTLDLDADIVVNNAGLQTVAPVQELLPERFALKLRVLEVTLGASFRLRRDVRPGYVRIRWSSWTAR
jgi:3-hydroxybutyrate dehydrogenase